MYPLRDLFTTSAPLPSNLSFLRTRLMYVRIDSSDLYVVEGLK